MIKNKLICLGLFCTLFFGTAIPAMASEPDLSQPDTLTNDCTYYGKSVSYTEGENTFEIEFYVSTDIKSTAVIKFNTPNGNSKEFMMTGRESYIDWSTNENATAFFYKQPNNSYYFTFTTEQYEIKGYVDLIKSTGTAQYEIDGTYKLDNYNNRTFLISPYNVPLEDLTLVISNNKLTVHVKSGSDTYSSECDFIERCYYAQYFFTHDTTINLNDDDEGYISNFGDENTAFMLHNIPIIKVSDTVDIDQPFIGKKVISNTVISNTGEYLVVYGGSISGTFEEGRHEYSAADQPIKIFIVNRTSGNTRSMGANNIKNMYVTVSNGEISKIEFIGTAQSHPDVADGYTLVIDD